MATAPTRSATAASWTALGALILRDLVVLRKHLVEFTVRTLVQPFLLCFVFLYVFPKIGQGIGASSIPGAESAFATVLVPGVVGLSIMFQGIQARGHASWPRSSASPVRSRTGSRPPAPSGWSPSPR